MICEVSSSTPSVALSHGYTTEGPPGKVQCGLFALAAFPVETGELQVNHTASTCAILFSGNKAEVSFESTWWNTVLLLS